MSYKNIYETSQKYSIKQKPRVPQLSSVNYSCCRISQKKKTSSTTAIFLETILSQMLDVDPGWM